MVVFRVRRHLCSTLPNPTLLSCAASSVVRPAACSQPRSSPRSSSVLAAARPKRHHSAKFLKRDKPQYNATLGTRAQPHSLSNGDRRYTPFFGRVPRPIPILAYGAAKRGLLLRVESSRRTNKGSPASGWYATIVFRHVKFASLAHHTTARFDRFVPSTMIQHAFSRIEHLISSLVPASPLVDFLR